MDGEKEESEYGDSDDNDDGSVDGSIHVGFNEDLTIYLTQGEERTPAVPLLR